MINNRQNGRRRGRGNNNGSGGGQRSGNTGRPDSGNRIDSRARGNATQLYEKYKNLARDAQMSGDRVNTEYYLQFADHYFRVLSETRLRFEEQNPNAAPQRRIQPVDSFDDFDGDEDYGDEGEPIRAGEQGGQDPRADQRGQDGRQGQRDGRQGQPRYDGQPRYEGRRDEQRDGRDGQRDEPRDVQRDGAQRDGAQRDDGRGNGQRDDGRGNGQRRGYPGEDGGQRDRGAERGGDRYRRDEERERPHASLASEDGQNHAGERTATRSPVAADRGEDSPDGAEPSPVEPRRRGRPRRVVEAGPVADAPAALDADRMPAALDADRLPPALSIPSTAADDEEPPRPRRRRVRAAGEASPIG